MAPSSSSSSTRIGRKGRAIRIAILSDAGSDLEQRNGKLFQAEHQDVIPLYGPSFHIGFSQIGKNHGSPMPFGMRFGKGLLRH